MTQADAINELKTIGNCARYTAMFCASLAFARSARSNHLGVISRASWRAHRFSTNEKDVAILQRMQRQAATTTRPVCQSPHTPLYFI